VQKIQRVLELPRPVKVALGSALLLILLILLFPFQTTVVPEWSFRVIDDLGAPVAGVTVTEHWQHYWIENEGHEEVKTTDAAGNVSFPARTVRASLTTRLFRFLRSLGRTGVERRRDAYASVVIWGSKDHTLTTFVRDPAAALPDKIVVHKR
jgi:hypothetical protein